MDGLWIFLDRWRVSEFGIDWNCLIFIFRMVNNEQNGQQQPGAGAQTGEQARLMAERQREALIQRVEAWNGIVNGADVAGMDIYALNTLQERGKAVWKQMEEAQLTMVAVADPEVDVVARYGQAFMTLEEQYFGATAALNRRIGALLQAEQLANANAAPNNAAGAAPDANQRPTFKLEMPTQYQNMPRTWGTFDGTLLHWLGFKSRFHAAVHSDKDIPVRNKFGFLKDSLEGEAARAIGGVLVNDASYEAAWDKLNKRYGPTYPLVRVYLDYLQTLPNLQLPVTADQLQRMSDVASEVRAQLEVLHAPVGNWDAVFVHHLHARLDEDNAAKWEDERSGDDFPTLQKMLAFLDKRANSLRANVVVQDSLQVVINKELATHKTTKPLKSGPPSASTGLKGSKEDWCPVHQAYGHRIYDCTKFLTQSRTARLKSVADLRLCPNCLKGGHNTDNCWDPHRCQLLACQPDNGHNSLLCPFKTQSMAAMNANVGSSSASSEYGGGYGPGGGYSRGGGRNRGRGMFSVFKRLGSPNPQ